jgi:predicted N-formylglutamate amidohydrolase
MSEAYRILGTPRFGGILVVSDHASNHVPGDIDLGIDPALLDQHIAVDIGVAGVAAHMARFYRPYHEALAALLDESPPSLILSLHSFTPQLASDPAQARLWQVGVLYNEDDRAARLAIPLLEAEGLVVGDQEPYSGRLLNATMNRHAEAEGRPYFGVEVRQDQIVDPARHALWAERLARIANQLAIALGA